ncbi:forkhead box protein N2b [Latimeria chalumnae]|uniref:Forkhead box protein G1 n=1 Tax=Latimeria chalumnae TaxID=7897 RepID=H3B1B0_LATCH|nr:PREDICTED: forkhead box protein N2 [Latimeria chalumnae]|eukprot:XP_005999348.1 PREDICTED: forkhead box protein N2 [Latimeria chalumnae]
MGPVTGMSLEKKGEVPRLQALVGPIHRMGTLPDTVSGARPKATLTDRGSADDEDLTNLNWLHENTNLLKHFSLENEGLPLVNPLHDVAGGNMSSFSPVYSLNTEKNLRNSKPPYSFSLLIYMAIEDSPNKCLPVKEIYSWILEHFPYFVSAPTGWKNSVRHNLSLNKCFRKVERSHGKANGKGSLWCVDPEYKPSLIQALKKQHFSVPHIFYTPPASPPSASSPPHHLTSVIQHHPASSIEDSDIDAATAMMLLNTSPGQGDLQCGQFPKLKAAALPKKRSHDGAFTHHSHISTQGTDSAVVTSDPKEDHNYSASNEASQRCESRSSVSSLSSVDGAYEFAAKSSRERSDGSEGFQSGEDTDDCENDPLGDSGFISQRCGNASERNLPRKKPRKEVRRVIDEELKEAAGSLLHLAGIRMCLDSLISTSEVKSNEHCQKQ